jgi:Winged helix DNA-binding domain
VGWFGAVQSQDIPGALWGLAQRIGRGRNGPTLETLGAGLDAGRFIRTHGPRPTWHFLAPADLRWILRLVGPRVEVQMGSMYRREGIDEATLRRTTAMIRSALAVGGAMTRAELSKVLDAEGINVDGLRLGLLGIHAELQAVVCNGPRRGRQATFALVDEFVPSGPTEAPGGSLRELTIRYFRSHGPALAHDMAWWSGLTVSSVREGIALAGNVLEGREVDGKAYWAAAGAFDPTPGLVPEPHVLLLPNYDEAIASYRDYGPALDEGMPSPNWVNDAVGAHLVVRDGLVVGSWRRTLERDRAIVAVTLGIALTAHELDAMAAAAEHYGTFLGLPVQIEVRGP